MKKTTMHTGDFCCMYIVINSISFTKNRRVFYQFFLQLINNRVCENHNNIETDHNNSLKEIYILTYIIIQRLYSTVINNNLSSKIGFFQGVLNVGRYYIFLIY